MNNPLPYFERNRLLKELCTFGIGGPARYYTEVYSTEELTSALIACQRQSLPYFILGKGSNCLFDDRGFDGAIIANRIDFIREEGSGLFHVGAGTSFVLLGIRTARQGFSGLEFAAGIPGSVGGAIYMNAGANGKEVSSPLHSIDYVTEEGRLEHLTASSLCFTYRFSSFQQWQGSIATASFSLERDTSARSRQLALLLRRKACQPCRDKSAGCIFRNPEKGHAAAFIDMAGLKGLQIGNAAVSSLHANFIVNQNGRATASEVLSLIATIQQQVESRWGICLRCEVCYVPYEGIQRRSTGVLAS